MGWTTEGWITEKMERPSWWIVWNKLKLWQSLVVTSAVVVWWSRAIWWDSVMHHKCTSKWKQQMDILHTLLHLRLEYHPYRVIVSHAWSYYWVRFCYQDFCQLFTLHCMMSWNWVLPVASQTLRSHFLDKRLWERVEAICWEPCQGDPSVDPDQSMEPLSRNK